MKIPIKRRFAQNRIAQACAFALVVGGLTATGAALHAATDAGTQIKNLATVTYEDAAGNIYSAQSNEAIITVAQVYSATIGVDVDVTAAAGQTVYLPYVLTNTGNGPDVFDLSAVNNISVADNIDSASIQIFHDINGSGEPDAGEPIVSSLTLQANVNNIANLVVAVNVPSTATPNQTLGVTLNAIAHNGTAIGVPASVLDVSPGTRPSDSLGGRDQLDSTNESLITVTNNASLATTKTAVPDFANNRVTYTLTVRNNGNQPAKDVVIFDGLPVNTTLVSSGVSGILGSNLDTTDTAGVLSEVGLNLDLNADGDIDDADELSLGIDLNNDGDTADSGINGIYAIDTELPAGGNVSLTFTVSYDPAVLGGGYVIYNQGHAAGDTDNTPGADSLSSSNPVQTTILSNYGVELADTGTGSAAGVNDGGDDDALLNFVQSVDTAAAGGIVQFNAVITNTGNSSDIFELTVNSGNFPAGTVFTFFDQSGVVQLGDSNGSGVDSGVVASGATSNIVVMATLPANAAGAGPFQATITATSANDPSATPESGTITLSLGSIIVAAVDLHNSANGVLNSDEDPLASPYAAVTTFEGQTGTTVTIPLFIDNESGGSDSYGLSAGSSYDGTTLSGLTPGWTVEFFETDPVSGNATGSAISNTAAIPGGTLDYKIIAVVSIPSDATLAVSDLLFDNNGDNTDTRLLGNADADGDYPIFFQVLSANTGANDIKLDAIDVNATRQLSLVTPGSNQLEPGGSVTYSHTLANNGNVDEVVELTSSNSQTGWTHTVNIDTNGDGVPDTALGSLVPGTITVLQADNTPIVVTVTDADNDGNPELTLSPSYSVPLSATVFAPANAAPAQVDTLTITATNDDAAGPTVSVTDQTTVINGQVRLIKTVALDAGCDGSADGAFAQVQSAGVAPGECAIWRVIAENQGAADAENVTITDAITAYSTYETGSLAYCITSGCAPASVTDAVDAGDAGSITGTNIVFYVGPGADATQGIGGKLIPGESATAQFRVKVD